MKNSMLSELCDPMINKSETSAFEKGDKTKNKTSSQSLFSFFSSPRSYIQTNFKAGGMKGSVFTILASTVGAGVLSLPYAINLSGLYLGIGLFIFGMIVSLYSCQLLVLAAEKTGKLTYESIGQELYGPGMRKFADINMIINNYGTVIGYIQLLKDLIPNAFALFGIENLLLRSSYLWGSLITIGLVYPLSLKKEISALRYTSFLSTCSCFYLAFAIIFSFFMETTDINSAIANAPIAEFGAYNILTSISLVVFSFTCHPNVIPIYEELERRSTKRGFKFLSRGLVIVLLLYLIVGIFGFLTFYENYKLLKFPSQILQANYSRSNVLIIIASIAIALTVLCGTPLLVHPCRDATLSLLYGRKETKRQFFVVVTLQVVSALGFALIIPNIAYVLTVVGSISSPVICFILPCMYYIKAFPGRYTRHDLFIAWFVMILMSLIGLSGFIIFWIEIFVIEK